MAELEAAFEEPGERRGAEASTTRGPAWRRVWRAAGRLRAARRASSSSSRADGGPPRDQDGDGPARRQGEGHQLLRREDRRFDQGNRRIDDARIVSPALANVGLSALGLEAPEATGSLAGEALASTVEETVDHVLTLPAEAFEDTLRLEAEIQERVRRRRSAPHPGRVPAARPAQIETAGEGGVWVLMPRAAWPQYRYKKYSHVFRVPITRQAARAVPTADGGTAETMLLDRG